jgi:hypothetical protein
MYYLFQIKFNNNSNFAYVDCLTQEKSLPKPFLTFLMPCDGYMFQEFIAKVGSDVVEAGVKLNKKGKWIADIHKMLPASRPIRVQFYDAIDSVQFGRAGGCTNYVAWVRDPKTGEVFEYPLTDFGYLKGIEKLNELNTA